MHQLVVSWQRFASFEGSELKHMQQIRSRWSVWIEQATIHANRAAAKIHDAIIMDQANTMQPSQQRLVNLSAEMSLEAVQAMEAAFDDMLKQLQQTLAAERQLCAFLSSAACQTASSMACRIACFTLTPSRS